MSLNGCQKNKNKSEDHDQLFHKGSMESHAILQQNQQKYCVYNMAIYSKQFHKAYTVPIGHVCWKYLHNTMYYTFKRASLSRFLACSVGKRMCLTTFSIQN
eukprot:297334_1